VDFTGKQAVGIICTVRPPSRRSGDRHEARHLTFSARPNWPRRCIIQIKQEAMAEIKIRYEELWPLRDDAELFIHSG